MPLRTHIVLEKIPGIFFTCNHVEDCSALHLEQQRCHAIKNRHFNTHVRSLVT